MSGVIKVISCFTELGLQKAQTFPLNLWMRSVVFLLTASVLIFILKYSVSTVHKHLPVRAADGELVRCCSPLLWAADRCDAGTHRGLFYRADSPVPKPAGRKSRLSEDGNNIYSSFVHHSSVLIFIFSDASAPWLRSLGAEKNLFEEQVSGTSWLNYRALNMGRPWDLTKDRDTLSFINITV